MSGLWIVIKNPWLGHLFFFSNLYHGVFGSVFADPTVRHFPKRKWQIPGKYQGREGGEGCVVMLGFDWAITEIDSKAIK